MNFAISKQMFKFEFIVENPFTCNICGQSSHFIDRKCNISFISLINLADIVLYMKKKIHSIRIMSINSKDWMSKDILRSNPLAFLRPKVKQNILQIKLTLRISGLQCI